MRGFRNVARVLLVAIGLLPFVSILFADSKVFFPFRAWFRLQCHGRLERTIAIASRPLPVCSRCLGIYAGLALGALVLRPSLPSKLFRIWLAIAAGVMSFDVVVQEVSGHAPWHPVRIATGLLLSYPVAVTTVRAFASANGAPHDPTSQS